MNTVVHRCSGGSLLSIIPLTQGSTQPANLISVQAMMIQMFSMLRDFQMHLLKNMDHISGSNSEYENHGYIFRPARNTYYIDLYRGQVGNGVGSNTV